MSYKAHGARKPAQKNKFTPMAALPLSACTKCKSEISPSEVLDPFAAKYPCCNKCWGEWKEYRVMVINEMRLDMSMPDHRKVLRKHEKIFAGVMTPDGATIDYTNEDNRNPDA